MLASKTDVQNIEAQNTRNCLYVTRNQFLLLARILISMIFIWSGIGKIMDFAGTQEYMTAYGMPSTSIFLLGGLYVLLGIKSRWGAIALALFLISATLIFHTDFSETISQGDLNALLRYRQLAPHARKNHPTEEHLLPLFVALGAGNKTNTSELHSSYTYMAF